jgi:radical SAM superfamily enzyme YgiQ (UPF0313 family)
MKVLLIYPPTKNVIISEWPKFVLKTKPLGYAPPLGILYIASYIQQYSSHEVFIYDYRVEKFNEVLFKKKLLKIHPHVLGISGHTPNWIDMLGIAKLAKKFLPSIHVILGGPHATMFPMESLTHKCIDYVVIGEGEEVFLKLLNHLEIGDLTPKIKGIAYRGSPQVYLKEQNLGPEDLDSLPFPTEFYKKSANSSLQYYDYIYISASRGCPFNCNFCTNPNRKFRLRSIKNIVDEIEEWRRFGIDKIEIVDDIFNISPERVIDFSREIIERGIAIKWKFEGRVDRVNATMLREARRAGCYLMEYGIETWCDEGLRILNKKITTEQIKETVEKTRRFGIQTLGYFMIGCPHEKNKRDLMKNLYFARKLKLDKLWLSILTLYPGSKLFNIAIEKGIIKGNEWNNFVIKPFKEFSPPVWEEHFTKQELFTILEKIYKHFYFHPMRIIKKISIFLKPFELKRAFEFFIKSILYRGW